MSSATAGSTGTAAGVRAAAARFELFFKGGDSKKLGAAAALLCRCGATAVNLPNKKAVNGEALLQAVEQLVRLRPRGSVRRDAHAGGAGWVPLSLEFIGTLDRQAHEHGVASVRACGVAWRVMDSATAPRGAGPGCAAA